jgi:hypothetical protein
MVELRDKWGKILDQGSNAVTVRTSRKLFALTGGMSRQI